MYTMKVFNIKCIFASLVDPGKVQSVQYTGWGLVRSRQSEAILVSNDPVGSGTHTPTCSVDISFSFSEIKTARSWSWLQSCICCRGDSSVNLHVTGWCDQAHDIATPILLCCTPLLQSKVVGSWSMFLSSEIGRKWEFRGFTLMWLRIAFVCGMTPCRWAVGFRRFEGSKSLSSTGVCSSTVRNSVEFSCQFCVRHFFESKNELRCFYRFFAFFFLLFCFYAHHKTRVMWRKLPVLQPRNLITLQRYFLP